MAKEIKLETKKETTETKEPGKAKVIELTTKKDVADNLDAQKKELKTLEKEESRLNNIEKTTKKAEEDVEKLIELKKGELMKADIEEMGADFSEYIDEQGKPVTMEKIKKATDKMIAKHSSNDHTSHTKKEKKRDINPLNWVRHIGTRALSGIAGFPSRVMAKVKHIAARPQQLWSKQFYTDLGKNILRTPKAILTTISGAVYKPHRDIVKFEDNFKDYGPEFANATDKNAIVRNGKKALRGIGKVAAPITGGLSLLPKFFANVGRGINHAIHETFEGIRDSKWHWNPRKWNLKPWKFSKTQEAFGKAFSWNKKGIPAGGKTVDVTHFKEEHTHKKAA